MYLVVASVLSVFTIEPASDKNGVPQAPKAEFNSRIVRYVFLGTSVHVVVMLTIMRDYIRDPKPFKCAIKPRSENAVKLVMEAYDVSNY